MATNFSTSVNIIRDNDKDLNYIPTPNAIRTVNQIASDFKKGIRTFNIIGSYGTGKSAFLWAFEQSIKGRKKYFGINILPNPRIDFINIVGEYKSLKDVFGENLDIKNSKNLSENIFSEIFSRYYDLGKENPILFIVIDEFGKILEYASHNEPEKELFFIQQLAEFVNNADMNIVLFTTVHQNFDAYSIGLNQAQKQEWTKVKGRFRELTFNEPIEQLLYLASEHISERSSTKKYSIEISKTIELLLQSKAFNVNEDYIKEIGGRLFPLDVISAYILTISLQKYGQNERSLFSFLESTDHTGLFQHTHTKEGFYNISDVYEYLIFNHYSFINSTYNPDFSAWKSIKASIEKAETAFENSTKDYAKIIKAIGLLNINSQAGAVLDKSFLINYSEECLGISNSSGLLEQLEQKKIIIYRNYSKRYVLFDGTDLDIPTALIEAGEKLDDLTDVVTLLNRYYQLPPVIAQKVMYETGTPRLFEYKISSYPINDNPLGEIDGYINLIFNEKNIINALKQNSIKNEEAILYCYYKNSKAIKELLFEIEKTKKVIDENSEDKVAVRELNNILIYQKRLLTHKIQNNFNGLNSEVIWIFKGEIIEIKSKREFNSKLSEICSLVYDKTPIFNNELVNKHKISPSIHTARKNYFKALVSNWDKPQLGFAPDKFPPEKTIYLSLLENNNINLLADEITEDYKPHNKNRFYDLWELSNRFLESAKSSRRKISEFTELLSQRPFKLKQGLIDFWLPTFLFVKRDDFALFSKEGYIPYINEQTLDLLVRDPEEYEIKTYSIEGVKLDIYNSYRLILNQKSKEKLTNTNIIETIKPFLTFYKDLPEYSKNTFRLSKEALALRNAISSSKDPEQTFFNDFPIALGFSVSQLLNSPPDLQDYITKLKDAIKDLRTCYDELINRIEDFIQSDIVGETLSFKDYKDSIQNRYKKLRRHLLLPYQKVFIERVDSQIDDRNLWINAVVFPFINCSLNNVKFDNQELVIYDKFKSMIMELDGLTNISKLDFKEDKEDIFDIQINSFIDGISKKLVRMPKNKKDEVNIIQENIKKILSEDTSLNIAALSNLLKEMFKK